MSERFDQQAGTLKVRIELAIREHVRVFEEQTGITPSRIDIEMVSFSAIGSPIRRYDVAGVRLEFKA